MEEKICTSSKYCELITRHTRCFERFLKEFETDGSSEMNPSFDVLNDCLDFSENILLVIPDITPVRIEIIGRIQSARLALAQECLELAYNHMTDAFVLWERLAVPLYTFGRTAIYESFFSNDDKE